MFDTKYLSTLGLIMGGALLSLACGGDDKKGGTGPGNDAATDPNAVTVGGICQRLAEIQCAGEAACCTTPGRTEAECITAQKAACDAPPVQLDAVAAVASTGFDAARAKAAFTQFEALAAACDPSIAAYGIDPNGLRGIVQGTIAAGATCNPTNQSDTVQIAAALASCAGPSTQACLPSDTGDWTCTALSPPGGPCFTDVNCQSGYCDNPTLALTGGACAPRKAAGAGCGLPNECLSFRCDNYACAAEGVQTAYCLAAAP